MEKLFKVNGKLLGEYIKRTGMTYEGFAEKAGVSRSTIHNIMSGQNDPSYFVIAQMAWILELTADEFLEVFFDFSSIDDTFILDPEP